MLIQSFALWTALVVGAEPSSHNSVTTPAWSSFRNGGSSVASGARLPLKWSAQEGIAWQLELEGYGQSAPVTWNGVAYVTAVTGPRKELCLLTAFDVANGKVLWRVESPASTGLPSNYSVARAAPTPMVDDRGVYVFFEGGDVIAVDHAGKMMWQRSLTKEFGEFDNHHGLGSSPAQTNEAIFINVQHRGPSYLIALDKTAGKTLWKVDRKSSMSWSSPITLERDGRMQVVISSSGTVDAYAAESGQQIWSLGEISGNSVPSPLVAGNELFLGGALSDFEVAENAVKSNLCLEFKDGSYAVKWRATRALSDYASPVVCGQCVYFINRAGVIYCLDRATGAEHYARRLPSSCWATPIVNNDRVYLFGRNGATTVIQAGPEWTELAQNELWDINNPPKPEKYVETPGGMGHGQSRGEGGGSGGGFGAMLLKNDKNGDGKLAESELPEDFKRLLARGDKNGDQLLDADEIKAMSDEFRKRRESSSTESRDPIVYGTAVSGSTLLVRTGTRLYAVRERTSRREK